MAKHKLAPHEKIKIVHLALIAGIYGLTDYVEDDGDVERDAARVGSTAAYADTMDHAPRGFYELVARLITEVD